MLLYLPLYMHFSGPLSYTPLGRTLGALVVPVSFTIKAMITGTSAWSAVIDENSRVKNNRVNQSRANCFVDSNSSQFVYPAETAFESELIGN